VINNVRLFMGPTRNATRYGNDGDKVHKGSSILLVINDTRLALFICSKVFLEMGDGSGLCEKAVLSSLNMAIGRLEEAAVPTEDFILRVAGEMAKGRRTIYDGMIVSADINYDERASHIHRAEDDTRMRAIGDSGHDGKKIKARG
jgi:hypothetical protein